MHIVTFILKGRGYFVTQFYNGRLNIWALEEKYGSKSSMLVLIEVFLSLMSSDNLLRAHNLITKKITKKVLILRNIIFKRYLLFFMFVLMT